MEQLTQEELQELQAVINEYEQATFVAGQYTIEIENLKADRKTLVDKARVALEKRDDVQRKLEEKYGTGTQVNPVTGELIKS